MDHGEEVARQRLQRALAVLVAGAFVVIGLSYDGNPEPAAAGARAPITTTQEPSTHAPSTTRAPRTKRPPEKTRASRTQRPPTEERTTAPKRPVRRQAVLTPNTVTLPDGGQARLVHMRLGSDGSLPIPNSLGEAAWWGAGIGSDGAMLLSGHVNWNGAIGPFQELWRTQRSDVVTVVDGAGRKLVYRVSEVITLDKDELPKRAEKLFGQSGPHRLVLVTCGGRYVGGSQGYEDNQIVVAVPD